MIIIVVLTFHYDGFIRKINITLNMKFTLNRFVNIEHNIEAILT